MRSEELPSKILHPLIVLPLGGFMVLYSKNLRPLTAVSWILTYITTALIPTTLTAWKTGEPGLDVISRSQRNKSYLVGISTLIITLAITYILPAPEIIISLGSVAIASSLVFGIANHVSKVSIHTGAVTFTAASLASFNLVLAVPIGLLSVAVGWSRVKLGQHTKIQVIQGAILGIICGAVIALI